MDKSGDGKLDSIEVANLLNKLDVLNNGMDWTEESVRE